MKNVSDRILSDAELSVLKKGLNYAPTPKTLPIVDLITATESACRNLGKSEADSLRCETVGVLKKFKPPKSNLNQAESEALEKLQRDRDIEILPADKGRCTVVMNKKDYQSKVNTLLSDSKTYEKLKKDPTQSYKKELAEYLKELRDTEKVIEWKLWKQLYPTTETPPRLYGLPKVHKANMPLRPIVSSVGSITYNCAKYLSSVLSPLVGKNGHAIQNSKHFAEVMKEKTIEDDEILISYDVTALFTSVPTDKALAYIKARLESDSSLSERTPLTPEQITRLLEICLNCTYFTFGGIFYRQIHGAAMGSPVSPIVCNLYMELIEETALRSAPNPPSWWYRYVDDTHTKQKKAHVDEFTAHINNIDPDIKFTMETEENGKLAFLDTNTIRKEDGSLKISVYRKPTHTDQYLDFTSAHPDEHKKGVVRTLHHRAASVVTDPKDLKEELQHVNTALKRCHYPDSILKTSKKTDKEVDNTKKPAPSSNNTGTERRRCVVMPYIHRTSEHLRRIFQKHNVNVAFRPNRTLRQMLVHPKDKMKKGDICGAVYHIRCQGGEGVECHDDYIGETERTLNSRFSEHRRRSSRDSSEVAKHVHVDQPGHGVNISNVKVLSKEPAWFERGVQEAVFIRQNRPTLNQDGGRFNLSHIYDPLLPSTHNTVPRVASSV